ncbi:ribonuclease HII [Leptospira langatensis]|uniref:Ribonuclease n=1 Tax=Leptospira langatensis TaxID=2484983 RepID=A0A5F1ZXZ6_9LEPT|nr:ribonuclease HII [Leptospira langatensis]TGK04256.1 ribonuclease HII [Leptospira langatensis]TGL43735.1 ribonuclease HII [Leptospira langatensis]
MPKNHFEPEEFRFFSEYLPCGIDEAGRGPYAGPLSVALVSFLPETLEKIHSGEILAGLDDSKKLAEPKRERLFREIQESAHTVAHAFLSHTFIDTHGINRAVLEGILKCYRKGSRSPIENTRKDLLLLIDGNYNFSRYKESELLKHKSHYYTKGDSRIASIAAASIIAKVKRDRFMKTIASKFPGYGFESHKGYGSAAHEEAIRNLGITRIHRRSFTKKFHAPHSSSQSDR